MAAENKKTDRLREDFATNRVLAVFSYAVLLILGLMLAYRGYMSVDTMFFTQKALYVVAALGAVGAVAGLCWGIFGAKRPYKVLTGWSVAGGCAILAICAFVGAYAAQSGVKLMYVFVPIVSVLVLIYFLYARDFFAISAVCACTAVLVWLISRSVGDGFIWSTGFYFGRAAKLSIVAFVLLAAYTVGLYLLKKNGGMLKLGGKTLEVFPAGTKYRLSFITAAVSAISILAGFILGATVAYYLVFAVVAYLFVLAVYYTVKML